MNAQLNRATLWLCRGIIAVCLIGIGILVLSFIRGKRPSNLSIEFAGYDPTNSLVVLSLTNADSTPLLYWPEPLMEQRVRNKWVSIQKEKDDRLLVRDVNHFLIRSGENTMLWIEPPNITNCWRAGLSYVKFYDPPSQWRIRLQPYSGKIGLNLTHQKVVVWTKEISADFTNHSFLIGAARLPD